MKDFWNINIGHVATIAVFCVGLGIAYQELRGEQKLAEQKVASEINRLETRINGLNEAYASLNALTREMAELRIELKYLRQSLDKKQISNTFYQLPDQSLITTWPNKA